MVNTELVFAYHDGRRERRSTVVVRGELDPDAARRLVASLDDGARLVVAQLAEQAGVELEDPRARHGDGPGSVELVSVRGCGEPATVALDVDGLVEAAQRCAELGWDVFHGEDARLAQEAADAEVLTEVLEALVRDTRGRPRCGRRELGQLVHDVARAHQAAFGAPVRSAALAYLCCEVVANEGQVPTRRELSPAVAVCLANPFAPSLTGTDGEGVWPWLVAQGAAEVSPALARGLEGHRGDGLDGDVARRVANEVVVVVAAVMAELVALGR